MNKIITLCFGILLITLPFPTQQKSSENTTVNTIAGRTDPAGQTDPAGRTDPAGSHGNTAGFGLLPTALCLLIPAATLGFIHS